MLDQLLQLGRVLLLLDQGVLETEAQTGFSGPVVGREIVLGFGNGFRCESHDEVKLTGWYLRDT